ncbi:MAG TPA: DMT family transporter, partial [Ramlibacter sp.]|nr:DMT family transporter [Ramlibacter sp.]
SNALVSAMPAVFVLIWSTGFIVARFGMPHSPPMKFLVIRYLLSVIAFAVWAVLARAAWPSGRAQWLHLGVTGVLMHAGYLGGVWSAVKAGMGAGLVALLVGLQPVLTGLWISARGGAVSGRQWVGLGCGLGGLLLVVWQKLGLGEVHALSLGLALVALLSITAGTLYQKHYLKPCDVRTANLVQLAAAMLVTLPLALLEPEAIRWTLPSGAPNGEMIGAVAWSVLGLTLGGSSLLYLLIQRGAATTVTSLMYLVPPTTALMAWLLFNEPITALTIGGVALTALGVSLVVRTPSPQRA